MTQFKYPHAPYCAIFRYYENGVRKNIIHEMLSIRDYNMMMTCISRVGLTIAEEVQIPSSQYTVLFAGLKSECDVGSILGGK